MHPEGARSLRSVVRDATRASSHFASLDSHSFAGARAVLELRQQEPPFAWCIGWVDAEGEWCKISAYKRRSEAEDQLKLLLAVVHTVCSSRWEKAVRKMRSEYHVRNFIPFCPPSSEGSTAHYEE